MNDGSTVLILGGGTGGIATASLLAESLKKPHRIVLVNRALSFHLGTTKTWVMVGIEEPSNVTRSLAPLAQRGVELVHAEIERIDAAACAVETSTGRFEGDYVVLALGAHLEMGAVPGLAEAAETFYTMQGAIRLREKIQQITGGDIVILIPKLPFMCPPGPYEGALLLHSFFRERGLGDKVRISVHTAEKLPMATAGPEAGRFIVSQLEKRGIAFHPNTSVARVDAGRRRVALEGGTEVPYDLLIAIPPHQAPRVVRESGLTNPAGWVPIDPDTLEVANSPAPGRLFALGDVTSVPLPGRFEPDVPLVLPKAGIFAEKEARVIACRIAAAVQQERSEETFDGQGFCYIEIDRKLAARGDGRFFDKPHPTMSFKEPDAEMVENKKNWVNEWYGKYL